MREEATSEKRRLRETIEQAKEQAREELKKVRSFSFGSDDFDLDLDEIMAEVNEELTEVWEDLEIELEDLREDKLDFMEDFEEDLKEDMEDMQDDLFDMQLDLQEEMKDLHEDLQDGMFDFREDLQDSLDDIFDDIDDKTTGTTAIINTLEEEMLADNLIDKNGKYSFLLKNGVMKVNGKNVSIATRQKYVSLLSELTNKKWSSNSKLKIVRKGKKNYSTIDIRN